MTDDRIVEGSEDDGCPVISEAFPEAVALANQWHAGHCRKGGTVPYIAHLLGVASLVFEAGGDEELAIAAMLHDAIEDRPEVASPGEIGRRFGDRVRGVVEACTDTLDEEKRGKEDWPERKAAYVEHLREHADDDALLVSCADKLHNARAIERDLREHGEKLWTRFNAPDRDLQLGHYRSLAAAFLDRGLEPRWLPEELDRVVERIARMAG